MERLQVYVDDEVAERLRVRAVDDNRSVSALCGLLLSEAVLLAGLTAQHLERPYTAIDDIDPSCRVRRDRAACEASDGRRMSQVSNLVRRCVACGSVYPAFVDHRPTCRPELARQVCTYCYFSPLVLDEHECDVTWCSCPCRDR